MSGKIARKNFERYGIERSPFSLRPTKRDLAALLGESVKDLKTLAIPSFKEQFVVRRQAETGTKKKKIRDLVYPVSRLRGIHERLKFHLNKVRQPSYLFSPRKDRSQRDNAAMHLDQEMYLTLDLKQFYPSTTSAMVRRWFQNELGMFPDIARLLTDLSTIDEKVSFGSPLTPVLCTLVHPEMFNEIADVCEVHELRYTLWVDDLTISGRSIPAIVLERIREIIRKHGLKSHKIRFHKGRDPVFITGIGVVGRKLIAPFSLNLKIKNCWAEYHDATTTSERDQCIQTLLANLGTARFIVGANTPAGQKLSDEMNALRQKRAKMWRQDVKQSLAKKMNLSAISDLTPESDAPF